MNFEAMKKAKKRAVIIRQSIGSPCDFIVERLQSLWYKHPRQHFRSDTMTKDDEEKIREIQDGWFKVCESCIEPPEKRTMNCLDNWSPILEVYRTRSFLYRGNQSINLLVQSVKLAAEGCTEWIELAAEVTQRCLHGSDRSLKRDHRALFWIQSIKTYIELASNVISKRRHLVTELDKSHWRSLSTLKWLLRLRNLSSS